MSKRLNSKFWNQRYLENDIGWDLGTSTPIFDHWIKNIKSPTTICVLGCGYGHDVLSFARYGHNVYAVDFAQEPLNYIERKIVNKQLNVYTIQSDIFRLPYIYNEFFDYIVEYTCFCAVPIAQRKDYMLLVNRLLKKKGRFIGVFFSNR